MEKDQKPSDCEEELLDLSKPAAPLNKEEEADLSEFLKKVSIACDNDKSVPGCVGLQVAEWLKELNDEAAKADPEQK